MKKVLRTFLVILVLFIPTYIAVFLYISANDTPVKTSSVYAMDLKDPNGTVYSFKTSNAEDNKFIDFFLDINSTAKNVPSLPDDLKSAKHYTVTYYSYDLQTVYNYYFSKTKPSNSYIVDHIGNVSRIDAQSTIEFLDSKYSSALYNLASQAPNLTVSSNSILPYEFDWHYYTYSAVSHNVDVKTAENAQKLELSYLNIPIVFDRLPGKSTIEISDSDMTVLFSDTLDKYNTDMPLTELIKANTTLNISIDAEWENNTSVGYGGSAKYRFTIDCIYDPPPQFWLGEDSIETGEFVVISGTNIENISDITFTAEPAINYNPVFYRDGDYVRALVPIRFDLNLSSQTVKFTLSYDGTDTTLDLYVKETTLPCNTKKYNYDNKVNISVRTDANLLEFVEFITSVESSDSAYFDGHFLFDSLGNSRAVFGDTINNGTEAQKFTSNGLAFVPYKYGVIAAVNNGIVVAVGNTDYGGTTVVIDHGFGLRSVYYCIRTASVSVGDIVTRGEEVGIGTSTSGYTDGLTSYIELWVNDVPVSYFPLLESGRTSTIVYSDK